MRAIVTATGVFTVNGQTFRAAIGYGGIKTDKQEGDGATPAGLLPLRHVLYRPDRGLPPQSILPVHPIAPDDGWCDDPTHPDYNRPVKLPASAEQLWREDGIYDIIGILGWNDQPVRPSRGSAIFLHIARPAYAPTQGCIALAQADLRQVLALGLTEIVTTAPRQPDNAAPAGKRRTRPP
jgi:L,D-peptidoglycan transpeptidase YkuD (ErfK/YbiS/YcfS/YnhG family)